MRGVDVVAQPHARVGDLDARGREEAGERLAIHDAVRGGDALLQRQRRGLLAPPAPVQPAGGERVVVVAGHDDDLGAGRERAADRAQDRLGALERLARRSVAQLERVAQQHEPVDAVSRGSSTSSARGRREHVGAGADAEVQVGDDERAHPRDRLSRCGGSGPRGESSRMRLGSMKRTSSWTTSNSETSCTPRSRKKSTSRWTSSSGALAPDEMPTTRLPSSHSSRDLRLVVDEVRVGAAVARDLDEPLGVGRVLRADHEHEIALRGHLLDGRLAVRRGVTDVVGARARDLREALAQAVDDRARLVDRKRRLGDVGDLARDRRPRARRRRPRSRPARLRRAPPPSCPRPPRARRGRSARSCSPRRRTSWPRRGPW